MAIVRFKISSSRDLPKGSRALSAAKIAAVNGRLREAMQPAVRDNQKKQRKSLEKATQTILNS